MAREKNENLPTASRIMCRLFHRPKLLYSYKYCRDVKIVIRKGRAAWCYSSGGWRCWSFTSKNICCFPHCCCVKPCEHGVGPRSPGQAVSPRKRPHRPAEPLHRAGRDRDTEPVRRVDFIRRSSAQTQEGECCF